MKVVILNVPVCDFWKVPHFLPPLTLHASVITRLEWDGHSLQAVVIIIQGPESDFHKLSSDSWAGFWGYTGYRITWSCLNCWHWCLSKVHISRNMRLHRISDRLTRCQREDKFIWAWSHKNCSCFKNANFSMVSYCSPLNIYVLCIILLQTAALRATVL